MLSQQSISDQNPWSTSDDKLVEGNLKAACAAVIRATGAKSRVEWGHYGSGYASFVDAWFYKATPEFNVERPIHQGEEHTGLIVLLSRLSPYFVFMEGEKRWHTEGSSSYLPEFGMLDRLKTAGVVQLAPKVQSVLESHGLFRVMKEQLEESLMPGLRVPTVMADRGFTQFDALFYWED